MVDTDLQDEDEAILLEEGEVPLSRLLDGFKSAEIDEEITEVSLVIGETLSDDSPGIERFPNALCLLNHQEIQNILKKCPIFKNLSHRILNTILPDIQAIKAQCGARLIGKSYLNRGLLVAKDLSSIRVLPSDTDDYFKEISEENILPSGYLGEFLFTDTGTRGSANLINTSVDAVYLFLPKEIFLNLPDRAKEEIFLSILRRPLLSSVNKDLEGDEFQIFEKRNNVPKEFLGITLSKEDETRFQAHQKEKYTKGMGIEAPDINYLGLIMSGGVEVFRNGEEFRKLAEINAGHTIFESNSAGVENTSVDIFSMSDETEILWIYCGNDDARYLDFLKGAVHGIYTKLEATNKLRGKVDTQKI